MVKIKKKNSAKVKGDYNIAVCPACLRWQSYSIGFGDAIGCEYVWLKNQTPNPLLSPC